MQIFLLQDGEKTGPYTVYEIASRVRDGKVDPETLGWYQGADDWLPLKDLPAVETVFSDSKPREEIVIVEEDRDAFAPRQLRSSTRFWARVTDISIVHSAIGIIAIFSGLIPAAHIDQPSIPLFLLPAAMVMLLDTILLHLFGTTPGKWLLRISVKTKSGGRIPLRTAFRRSFTVWWRGIGLWIPGVSLIMMIFAQTGYLRNGYTPWDDACGLEVEHGKVTRWRVAIAIGLIIGLVIAVDLVIKYA